MIGKTLTNHQSWFCLYSGCCEHIIKATAYGERGLKKMNIRNSNSNPEEYILHHPK